MKKVLSLFVIALSLTGAPIDQVNETGNFIVGW